MAKDIIPRKLIDTGLRNAFSIKECDKKQCKSGEANEPNASEQFTNGDMYTQISLFTTIVLFAMQVVGGNDWKNQSSQHLGVKHVLCAKWYHSHHRRRSVADRHDSSRIYGSICRRVGICLLLLLHYSPPEVSLTISLQRDVFVFSSRGRPERELIEKVLPEHQLRQCWVSPASPVLNLK